MQKRILSLVLAVVFILMSFANLTVFAEEAAHVEFLKAMGAIDSKFDTTGVVTRGQFVDLIVKMLYQDVSFETDVEMQSPFNDVFADTLYFANIKAAKDMKIINGDTYNNFYPDRAITMTEAVVMLINAYGYTAIANAKGGYPTGYLTVANEINMLRGLSMNDEPTGDILLKLVYNSLFADVISLDSVDSEGNIELSILSGVNTLSEKFNITKYSGTVVDNGIAAIEGTSQNYEDKVVIKVSSDGSLITANIEDDRILGYLGSRVDAYVRYNEVKQVNELVCFSISSSSNEITIQADMITSASTSQIVYEKDKESGDTATIKLEGPAPLVLYNGTVISKYTANDLFRPKSGFVRVVDTDGNGGYDLVDILSFNYREGGMVDGRISHNNNTWNVVADVIDTENGYISCKENPGINNININEDDSIIRFVKNDNVKSIEDIKSGDVISVALSPSKVDGKDVYFLAVCDETVSGKLTSYTNSSVTVNGVDYDISSTILSSFRNLIEINSTNEFKLDILGDVTYVVRASGVSKNYAYLISAGVKSNYEDILYAKMLTKDGKIEYFYFADSVTIDGLKVSGGQNQLNAITLNRYDDENEDTSEGKIEGDNSISRPVIYAINSNKEVIRIDTDYHNDSTVTDTTQNLLYKSMSPIPYTDEEVENYDSLKAGLRYAKTTKFIPAQMTFDGRFFVDANTVVFCVPDIDTYGLLTASSYISSGVDSNDKPGSMTMNDIIPYEKDTSVQENYKVILPSAITTITRYDVQAYDIDPETGVAGMLVIRGDDSYGYGGYTTTTNLNVVLRITDAYDEINDKMVKKIYYTKNGTTEDSALVDLNEISEYMRYIIEGVSAENNSFISADVPALKAGDIIRIEKSNGYVSYIDRVIITNKTNLGAITGFLGTPNGARKGYSNSEDYTDSKYQVQPFDMNTANGSSTYQLVKPYALSGNILSVYLPKVAYSALNIKDTTGYTSLFYNMASVPIVVVNIKTDSAVSVKQGSTKDIRFDDSNSYLFLCTSSYAVKHAIIFNFEQ